jgi:hypothetical protein
VVQLLNMLRGGFPYVSGVVFYFLFLMPRVTMVKLFCNENRYLNDFVVCIINLACHCSRAVFAHSEDGIMGSNHT